MMHGQKNIKKERF